MSQHVLRVLQDADCAKMSKNTMNIEKQCSESYYGLKTNENSHWFERYSCGKDLALLVKGLGKGCTHGRGRGTWWRWLLLDNSMFVRHVSRCVRRTGCCCCRVRNGRRRHLVLHGRRADDLRTGHGRHCGQCSLAGAVILREHETREVCMLKQQQNQTILIFNLIFIKKNFHTVIFS